MTLRRPRPRVPRIALLAAVLAVVLACTGLSACSGSGSGGSAPTDAQVAGVLAQHGAAVRGRDRTQFLAGLDSDTRAAGFRRAQAARFANLAKLPIAQWSYHVGPAVPAVAQATAHRDWGSGARVVHVTLHYRLRGVDETTASHDLWWTFVRHDGHVVIAADDDLTSGGGRSWAGPWDFGPLQVVHGRHSLVLGPARDGPLLRTVASTVDAAVPAVTAVWGRAWTQDVAVLVPATHAALVAALGSQDDPAAVPGTADDPTTTVDGGRTPLSGKPIEQRVVVEPAVFDRLSALGRRITLTHEVTHVASAAATTEATPRWLVEGLAEYVANLHTGQPVITAASELRRAVRQGHLPDALPGDTDFDNAATGAQAYEEAWLACRLIAHRAGQAALVRLYRQVGQSPFDGDEAVRGPLRSALHESLAAFVAQWRASLRAQLG